MLSSITNLTNTDATYAVQSSMTREPKIPASLKKEALDTYERADGSKATREDGEAMRNMKARDYAERVRLDREAKAAQPKQERPETEEDKKVRELLHQFAGQVFIGQMIKSMRATQQENPYFHGGRAEEIFQGQLDMTLTDQISKSTSRTLSDPMYRLMRAPKTSD